MRKLLLFTLVSLFLAMVSGCNQQEVEDETPQMLNVDLTITPEHAEKGQPILFEAKVTYGEENVTDADEVAFEIWRSNEEEHEKIEVEHKENGIYSLEKTFDTDGTYYVYAHVTARSMHNMPKKEFVVGVASEKEEDPSSSTMDGEEEDHSGH